MLFGLKPIGRDAKTGKVTGLQCCFCIKFERERNPGAKHKPSTTFMAWLAPFQYDNAEQHILVQHLDEWAAYKALETNEEQKKFFVEHIKSPFVNSLHAQYISASRR